MWLLFIVRQLSIMAGRSGRLRVARWFSSVLLGQQGLRHRGDGDGFFALLLGGFQRTGEVGEFAT